MHGSVIDTSEVYGGHAFLVLPSYREGLPLVLLEAKINHLPCISFDILTGPREIIKDRVNGYLINPYDIEDMAAKICSLIENREVRERFSEDASIELDKFEKNRILKKWIGIIEKNKN